MTVRIGFPLEMRIPWESFGNGNKTWECECESAGIDVHPTTFLPLARFRKSLNKINLRIYTKY